MQIYKVMMLHLAEEDIRNNTDYIAFEKKTPETALELAMGFRNTIAKLEFMPKQHELDEDGELAARMIRKCYYKNYKIYFFIDEKNSTVYVLRVLHMLVNAKPLLLNMTNNIRCDIMKTLKLGDKFFINFTYYHRI